MRKLFYTIIIALAFLTASAQAPQYLESPVSEVKIFKTGAQIKKIADYNLKPGNHLLVLRGISAQADLKTVLVSPGPNLKMLSVSAHFTKNPDPRKVPIIKMLEDSLRAVTLRYNLEQNTLKVFDEKLSILAANKKLGTDKGVSAAEIEDALDVYENRLPGILKGRLESQNRLNALDAAKKEAETRLENFRRTNETETYELRIVASANQAINGALEVEYYTPEAGWEPNYDLIADGSGPLRINYRVAMWQSTGENWNNVKMRLFSGNPSLAGNTPHLYPQYLNIYTPAPRPVTATEGRYDKLQRKSEENEDEDLRYDSLMQSIGNADYGTAGIEYNLPDGFTLPGDGGIISAELKRETLPARYRHFSAPKLDRDVFMVALVSDWQSLEILPGEANIYFGGSYVGRTYIDPRVPLDTIPLSLGRDKKVLAFRAAVKEQSKKAVSGSKISEQYVWLITLKNERTTAVEVLVEDQVPLSASAEIEVKVKETGGAIYDPSTGKLSWTLQLAPGESKSMRFGYELRYPKGKILGTL